jgi:hypothetical protein
MDVTKEIKIPALNAWTPYVNTLFFKIFLKMTFSWSWDRGFCHPPINHTTVSGTVQMYT